MGTVPVYFRGLYGYGTSVYGDDNGSKIAAEMARKGKSADSAVIWMKNCAHRTAIQGIGSAQDSEEELPYLSWVSR